MKNNLTLQATGDFPFLFYIEKAIPTENGNDLMVEGIASTVNVDHDNERMAKQALISMANIINKQGVPLRYEHQKDDNAIIGNVYEARIDERNQLWIKAAIDSGHPAGPLLHESLKNGTKFGLSVGGRVKNAVKEMVESVGKQVKTFYDVILDEVSVTRKPANYDSWLFAKSIAFPGDDTSKFRDSPLYNEFLFENQQLDYLQAFAKSVPPKAWKRTEALENNNNKSMDPKDKKVEDKKNDETPEKAIADMKDTTDDTKEKSDNDKKEPMKEAVEDKVEDFKQASQDSVSKSEFQKFQGEIVKAITGLTKLFMAKSDNNEPAMDSTNPNKAKEKEVGDEAVKSESDEPAMDETNPNKAKPKQVGDEAKKARDGQEDSEGNGDDEMGEREKSEDSEDEDKKEKHEAGEGDKDDDSEYEVKSMGDAIKHINRLNKQSTGQKTVTKSVKSNVHPLDEFAATVSMALDRIEEKFAKSGNNVLGHRRAIIDAIQQDKGLQTEIMGMLKMPGFKKSMSVIAGEKVPFAIASNGERYRLTPIADKVEKSAKDNAMTFKDLYKKEYSALGQQDEQQQRVA